MQEREQSATSQSKIHKRLSNIFFPLVICYLAIVSIDRNSRLFLVYLTCGNLRECIQHTFLKLLFIKNMRKVRLKNINFPPITQYFIQLRVEMNHDIMQF